MKTQSDFQQQLRRLHGRGYKAYKSIQGSYDYGRWLLFVDHVQGDPFAAPSKIRVRISQEEAHFPSDLWNNSVRELAFRDYLARTVHGAIRRFVRGNRGIGKSGKFFIDVGKQEILERTAVIVGGDWIEARLEIGLPAYGRTIEGPHAEAMFFQELPQIVEDGLHWKRFSAMDCRNFVNYMENFQAIQSQLSSRDLVAFVGNASILPRASGISDRPLDGQGVLRFQSPPSLEVSFDLPHARNGDAQSSRTITGMGIPKGVTLIVGGGYHGKSTLLQALQRSVYPHIPGDGREYVAMAPDAVKVRAEDGRPIREVDISAFIGSIPQGVPTKAFSSDNASGSTSQAAGIVEALEIGANVLLLDEDTSATNFMVRDARMQALVHQEDEPITPFIDRVRELYEQLGVSTILVMGGCGDYFDVADTVIHMKNFLPLEVTEQAQNVARRFPTGRHLEKPSPLGSFNARFPWGGSVDMSRGKHQAKITAHSLHDLTLGTEDVDLQGLEQLLDPSQTRSIGYVLYWAAKRIMDGSRSIKVVSEEILQFFDQQGMDRLSPFSPPGHHPGNFSRPRIYEIVAALNRVRSLKFQKID